MPDAFHRSFARAQRDWEHRRTQPPPEDPVLEGEATRYLLEGPHEGREVTIEYSTRDGLTIYVATINETGEEIDPNDIGERDREAFRDRIWEDHDDNR